MSQPVWVLRVGTWLATLIGRQRTIQTIGTATGVPRFDRGGNCYGSVRPNGYNLSSNGTCNLHDSGDRNNDPLLGTLGYYGGPL
jgi:hypothetical protein